MKPESDRILSAVLDKCDKHRGPREFGIRRLRNGTGESTVYSDRGEVGIQRRHKIVVVSLRSNHKNGRLDGLRG